MGYLQQQYKEDLLRLHSQEHANALANSPKWCDEQVVAHLGPVAHRFCVCCVLVVLLQPWGEHLFLVLAENSLILTHTSCSLKLIIAHPSDT